MPPHPVELQRQALAGVGVGARVEFSASLGDVLAGIRQGLEHGSDANAAAIRFSKGARISNAAAASSR
jgi:hypothetical protein